MYVYGSWVSDGFPVWKESEAGSIWFLTINPIFLAGRRGVLLGLEVHPQVCGLNTVFGREVLRNAGSQEMGTGHVRWQQQYPLWSGRACDGPKESCASYHREKLSEKGGEECAFHGFICTQASRIRRIRPWMRSARQLNLDAQDSHLGVNPSWQSPMNNPCYRGVSHISKWILLYRHY